MKALLVFALLATLMLALAGCGSKSDDASASTTKPAAGTSTTGTAPAAK